MHAQKWPLFLPKTREENPLFEEHTKNVSHRRFDKDNFTPVEGFHNDEVGCSYFQVFATNLPFGPLNGDTWWCKKWRKNHSFQAKKVSISLHAWKKPLWRIIMCIIIKEIGLRSMKVKSKEENSLFCQNYSEVSLAVGFVNLISLY